MANAPHTRLKPDRAHVNADDEDEIRRLSKHFGVSREELLRALDKVGNSVAALRKQLGKPDERQ